MTKHKRVFLFGIIIILLLSFSFIYECNHQYQQRYNHAKVAYNEGVKEISKIVDKSKIYITLNDGRVILLEKGMPNTGIDKLYTENSRDELSNYYRKKLIDELRNKIQQKYDVNLSEKSNYSPIKCIPSCYGIISSAFAVEISETDKEIGKEIADGLKDALTKVGNGDPLEIADVWLLAVKITITPEKIADGTLSESDRAKLANLQKNSKQTIDAYHKKQASERLKQQLEKLKQEQSEARKIANSKKNSTTQATNQQFHYHHDPFEIPKPETPKPETPKPETPKVKPLPDEPTVYVRPPD